jgi:hypothetical protein
VAVFLQIINIFIIFQRIFHLDIRMALTANRIIYTLLDNEIEKIKNIATNLWEGPKDLTLMTGYRFFDSPAKDHLRIKFQWCMNAKLIWLHYGDVTI